MAFSAIPLKKKKKIQNHDSTWLESGEKKGNFLSLRWFQRQQWRLMRVTKRCRVRYIAFSFEKLSESSAVFQDPSLRNFSYLVPYLCRLPPVCVSGQFTLNMALLFSNNNKPVPFAWTAWARKRCQRGGRRAYADDSMLVSLSSDDDGSPTFHSCQQDRGINSGLEEALVCAHPHNHQKHFRWEGQQLYVPRLVPSETTGMARPLVRAQPSVCVY